MADRARSSRTEGTPRRESSTEAYSPTGPPPTISTGGARRSEPRDIRLAADDRRGIERKEHEGCFKQMMRADEIRSRSALGRGGLPHTIPVACHTLSQPSAHPESLLWGPVDVYTVKGVTRFFLSEKNTCRSTCRRHGLQDGRNLIAKVRWGEGVAARHTRAAARSLDAAAARGGRCRRCRSVQRSAVQWWRAVGLAARGREIRRLGPGFGARWRQAMCPAAPRQDR